MIVPWVVLLILAPLCAVRAQLKFIDALAGTGSASFSGDNGPASSTTLNSPRGLWMTSNGDIFLADTSNHRVRKITASTNIISTVAGIGTAGFSGDSFAANIARLNNPHGVWVSSVGELFIADTNNCRIRRSTSGMGAGIISTFAGTISACGTSTYNNSATSSSLCYPQGVIGDSAGAIFISNTDHDVILKVQNGITTIFAGKPNNASFSGDGSPATSATLNYPIGLWLTTDGALLVADSGNHRIRSISLTGSRIIRTVIGDGKTSWRGDEGSPVSISLNTPRTVCVGADGAIYVADAGNNRIRVVDSSTNIITTFAGGSGPGKSVYLNEPTGIALDSDGNLFFSDTNNHKVRKYSLETNMVSDFVDQLSYPRGLFIDTIGNLFIADSGNNRIQKVNLATATVSTVFNNLIYPRCIHLDTAGAIYIGENNRISKIDLNGILTSTVSSSIRLIDDVYVDTFGTIYYADFENDFVGAINNNGQIRIFAGYQGAGFSDNLPATSAKVDDPTGLWFDSLGNCYIVDNDNNRVRKVSAANSIMTTVAGNGAAAFAGDGGNPLQASFNDPHHVIGDNKGNLYVTDKYNHRVRKIDLANNKISTIIGYGLPGGMMVPTEGTFATNSFLNNPSSVIVDSQGTVYFTDAGNNRIRKIIDIAYPSGQPTSNPTQPTSQPTSNPTQPTSAPSSQPSQRPTTNPTSQPSSQPSRTPTTQPTSQPSSRPSRTPTTQPTSQPSSQPSHSPTTQPTSVPSSQPPNSPTTQPTSVPSSQPSHTPTTQPSSMPSSQPSHTPTTQPTSMPSSQPSRIPTTQPTSQPSSQPSPSPTTQPTSQPSSQPSHTPTSRPTSQPSSQPSRKPTTQPTSIPSSQPSQVPTTQPTSQPSSQPSRIPSTQPTSVPSSQPSHTPTAQPTMQPSSQPSWKPTAQPTTQPSTQPSRKPTAQPTTQPSSHPSQAPTTQPTTQPSSQPSRKPTTQPTSTPSSQPSHAPTTQPTSGPSSQPSHTPTAQPKTQPSSQPSHVPTAQPTSQPSLQPSRTPTTQPTSGPSSQPSHSPTSQPTTQPSRKPNTHPTSQPSSQPSRKPTLHPTSMPSSQPSNSPTTQATSVPSSQPSHSPTTQPTSTPSSEPSHSPTTQPTSQPSSQPSLTPTAQPTTQPSSQPSHEPTAQPTSIPSSQPSNTPSSQPTSLWSFLTRAPQLKEVVFSNDRSQFVLLFDKFSDRSFLRPFFKCSFLFWFSCAENSLCEWDGNAAVTANLPNQDHCAFVGDPVRLQSKAMLRADCASSVELLSSLTSSVFDCASASSWPISDVSASVIIQAPLGPIQPIVSLSAPTAVGRCASLTLDASASMGSAGRSWKSAKVRVSIYCAETRAITNLGSVRNTTQTCDTLSLPLSLFQQWLDAHFTVSPPTVIPEDFLVAGYNYTFSLTLCNAFSQCGEGSTVVSVRDTFLPLVTIPGSPSRSVKRSQSLSLSVSASLPQCLSANNTTMKSQLQYQWAVFENNSLIPTLVSSSRDPSRLLLQSYSLFSDHTYTIVVTVFPYSSTPVGGPASSFLPGMASVQVNVLRGDIVAKLKQGTNARILRPNERLLLDASPSTDEDLSATDRDSEAVSSALSFTWSCEQLLPVINSSCLSVFAVNSLSLSMQSSVLQLLSLPSSSNTLSVVSLTVTNEQSGRRDSLSVHVQVLSSFSPTVSLSSNIADTQTETGREILSSDKSLQLFAVVNIPPGILSTEIEERGEVIMKWNADMLSEEELSFLALTPLSTSVSVTSTQTAPMSVSMSLILPRNVLQGGMAYTFTLTCVMDFNNTTSIQAQNQLTISVNAAPSPGFFSVTPFQQQELSNPFSFFCGNWQDNELPLSFAFGYYTHSLSDSQKEIQTQLVLKSRSEQSFASLLLPAGAVDKNHTLTTAANVYDALSAMNTAVFDVRVLPRFAELSVELLEDTLSSLFDVREEENIVPDVDTIRQQTAIGSSLLNAVSVNCSLAPNCSVLQRHSCARTSHTCGPCVSRDLVGDDGDSNNPCLSLEELTLVNSSAHNDNYNNSLGFIGNIENLTSLAMIGQQKTCVSNCSSHGHCVFRSLSAQALLHNCPLYSFDCSAQCVCEEGYTGTPHCALSDTELAVKVRMRERMVQSVAFLAVLEDDSESAITERINAMNAVALISDELSTNATKEMLRFANDTLRIVSSQGFDPLSSAPALLSTISTAAEAIKLSLSDSKRRRLISTYVKKDPQSDDVSGEDVQITLHSLGELCAASMEKDQFPQNWLYDSFSMRVQRIETLQSTQEQAQTQRRFLSQSVHGNEMSCEHHTTIVLPQSAKEKALGKSPSTLSIPSCSAKNDENSDSTLAAGKTVSVVALTLSSVLYTQNSKSQFQSQPISLSLSELACGNAVLCNITLRVPWMGPLPHTLSSAEEGHTDSMTSHPALTCDRGFVGTLAYPCSNGSGGEHNVSVQCNGTFAVVDIVCPQERTVPSCEQLFVGDKEIDGERSALCSLESFTNDTLTCTCAFQRDKEISQRALQTAANNSLSFPSSPSTTVSVTVVGMLQSTTSSFLSTVRSADDLDVSVLETGGPVIGTLGGFLCAVMLGMWLGARWDMQEERDKNRDISEGKPRIKDKQINAENTSSETSVTAVDSEKEFKNIDGKKPGGLLSLLDRSLPLFLRGQPLAAKTKAALQQHHRWFQVYFVHSVKLGRMLRVFSLATNTMIMLFAQSLFYNLSQGDDGSCDALQDEVECFAQKSAYRSNGQQCVWDASSTRCVYLQPDSSLRVVLFVAVFSSVVSVPLAMFADWLIVHVLAAPTRYGPWRWTWWFAGRVQSNGGVEWPPSVMRSQGQQSKRKVLPQPIHEKEIEKPQETALWDAQCVWRELDSSLHRYRSQLSGKDRHLFDGKKETMKLKIIVNYILFDLTEQWGLQENGQFTPIIRAKRSWMSLFSAQKTFSSFPGHSQKSVADCIRAHIERAVSVAARENAEFHLSSLPLSEEERNKRVLFHFQTDLLVGLSEETLEAQDRREYLLLQPRHVYTKCVVWALLFSINLGMLFYLFLFGVSQDTHRQRAWVQSFATWLLMEIVFYSSLVVLISHVVVPSLLVRNAAEVRRKMIASLIRCQRELKLNRTVSTTKPPSNIDRTNTPTYGDNNSFSFNAASFLFVSHRLAMSNPNLRASQLVLAYHTPWPRESYRRENLVDDCNNPNGEGKSSTVVTIAQMTDGFIALCVFLLTNFLKLPNQSQDIALRLVITLSFAYVSSWHLTLHDIHPVLVIVPSCVCMVIAHFFYLLFTHSSEREFSKIGVALDEAAECAKVDEHNDDISLYLHGIDEYDSDYWSLSSDESSEQVDSLVNSPNAAEGKKKLPQQQQIRAHMNRRQSIQEGLRMLEQQKSFNSSLPIQSFSTIKYAVFSLVFLCAPMQLCAASSFHAAAF